MSRRVDFAEETARPAKQIRSYCLVLQSCRQAGPLLDDEGHEGPRPAPVEQQVCPRDLG